MSPNALASPTSQTMFWKAALNDFLKLSLQCMQSQRKGGHLPIKSAAASLHSTLQHDNERFFIAVQNASFEEDSRLIFCSRVFHFSSIQIAREVDLPK